MPKFIDTRRLNDSCDILEVWNALGAGPLIKKGNVHKARCLRPELHNHGDSHPSLLVGGKKNMAWCPVCRSSWNSISLAGEVLFNTKASELRGEEFVKSCLFLSDRFLGGKIPLKDGSWIHSNDIGREAAPLPPPPKSAPRRVKSTPTPKKTAPPPELVGNAQPPPSAHPLPERAIRFLEIEYGLTAPTVHQAGLGYMDHPSLGPGIVYGAPFENPRAWKYKSLSRDAKGKRRCLFLGGDKDILYNKERPVEGGAIALTGGEEKALLLSQLGYRAVSPLFGEKNLSSSQAECIVRKKPSRVILCMDADKAGREANHCVGRELINAGLPREKLFCLPWPPDLEPGYDVNNLLLDRGKEVLVDLIESAVPFIPTIFCHPDTVEETYVLASVEKREISWLWEPYIPRGMITLLTDDPNAGKTWLALQICAIVSRGHPFPDAETGLISEGQAELNQRKSAFQGLSGNSVYISYEDDLRIVIKGRVDTMDCDQKGIIIPKNLDGQFRLDQPARVESILQKFRPQVMIFDPLTAALGSRINMNDALEVTALLTPIARLAESYDCAIILVRHRGKADREKVLDMGLGSIAFSGVARSEIFLGVNPDDPGERVICLVKSVGPAAPSIAYRCDGRFQWCGLSDLDAWDLGSRQKKKKKSAKRIDAELWLESRLAEGPVMFKNLKKEAGEQSPPISENLLREMKKSMSIKSIRVSEGNHGRGVWMWKLEKGGMQDEELL